MNNFLIKRPIAVMTIFVAFFVLGIVSFFRIPVSLMPDVDIPEITVYVEDENSSARILENKVAGFHQSLMQISGLDNIESSTKNGEGVISMHFEFGTDIDFAFLEVNEKIDKAMNQQGQGKRPRVVKSSISDLPAIYLELSPKGSDEDIIDISNFARTTVKRQIEQLSTVAMADMSGLIESEIVITPDKAKMQSLNLPDNFIEQLIKKNNADYGSIMLTDANMQYFLNFKKAITNSDDIANIYFKIPSEDQNPKVFQLKDIAQVSFKQKTPSGYFKTQGKNGISIAIVKKNSERIEQLKLDVQELKTKFEKDYPNINFKLAKDQAQLLDYSIGNLKQSLIIGMILAFIILFFFLRSYSSPVIVAFSIPTSLLLSVFVFDMIGLSINIISLSGIILAVGMMLDNSIIVIENISRQIDEGEELLNACVKGTKEIATPLLSSILTTISIFFPLVFLSGISGALFYDQALAVAIGLASSFVVSIILIPVIFSIIYKRFHKQINLPQINLNGLYDKGFDITFYKRGYMFVFLLIVVVLGSTATYFIKKEKLPQVHYNEFLCYIDWNQNIDLKDNKARIESVLKDIPTNVEYSCEIGNQQYVLHQDYQLNTQQALIYFKFNNEDVKENLQKQIQDKLADNYSNYKLQFAHPKNIFEKIFRDNSYSFALKLRDKNNEMPRIDLVNSFIDSINLSGGDIAINPISNQHTINISLDVKKLSLYDIDFNSAVNTIQTYLKSSEIDKLNVGDRMLSIVLSQNEKGMLKGLYDIMLRSSNNIEYPLREFVDIKNNQDYKFLKRDNKGLYAMLTPLKNGLSDQKAVDLLIKSAEKSGFKVDVKADYIENENQLLEMLWVMSVSVIILFLILAAQFESLTLPLILLAELPLDIAFALIVLYGFGYSLNIMAMIGLIVIGGIIINDSILKIDAANKFMEQGMEALEAIHQAGYKRLNPIVMTTLTTILAVAPILFGNDLGSDLQKPLAITLIAGLSFGTLVSLYLVPWMYWRMKSGTQAR
jgi:multidrug efflux pump subunit AcrB